MAGAEGQPRSIPVLNSAEQTAANELFNRAAECAHGQMVLLGGSESALVTVKKKGRRGSMEVFRVSPEVGQVTLRLRRGRKGW